MESDLIVSICMITYNHESYIRKAIEGVLMQKCNFKIELVIGEDCSSDNTNEICENFAKKHKQIRLLHRETNMGAINNFFSTLNACTGKYIAICEGDDYWTDEYKLQKQVDFLEENPDYSLVHTRASIYNEVKSKYESKTVGRLSKQFEFLISNPVATLTTVFRKESFNNYLRELIPQKRDWKMGDYPIWLWISFNSKIHFIPEITAVYRLLQGSVSRPLNNYERFQYNLSTFDIANKFASEYCSQAEYVHFLNKRFIFLYLYCVKNNIDKEEEYINKINSLEHITIKVKMILFIFHNLKLSNLYHLIFHNKVTGKSFTAN